MILLEKWKKIGLGHVYKGHEELNDFMINNVKKAKEIAENFF